MQDQSILTAIEPNDEGQHVWRVASRIAQKVGAGLNTINVIEPAVEIYAYLNFAPLLSGSREWQRVIIGEHQTYFETFFETEAPSTTGENLLVKEGYPGYEIAARAKELKANLIAMGVHNRRGLSRLLGSTTHNVLNRTQIDLLAVHPDSNETPYRLILVAVDSTDFAEGILEKAKPFTEKADEYNILTVVIPLNSAYAGPGTAGGLDWSFTDLTEEIVKQTRQKVTNTVSKHGFSKETVTLIEGDPRDEIIKAATEMQADLIVMGGHRRGALNHLLLGSTARAVLNQTPCDVLVCT
jgi:nucleotide-binding universal stress UspA family protein